MTLALHAHAATFHGTRRHLDGKGLLLLRFRVHHAYFLFSAVERLIERNRKRDLLVRSLFRLRLTSATPEIPIRPEGSFTMAQAFQDIGPVDATTATAAEGIASAACGVGVRAATERISSPKRIASLEGNLVLVRGAVLVVHLAFFIIRKHLVGLVDLLELRLVATGIGVMFTSKLTKCFFDLTSSCASWNA